MHRIYQTKLFCRYARSNILFILVYHFLLSMQQAVTFQLNLLYEKIQYGTNQMCLSAQMLTEHSADSARVKNADNSPSCVRS